MSYGRPGPQLRVPSNPLGTSFAKPRRSRKESLGLPKYGKALPCAEITTLSFENTSVCTRLCIKRETCVQFYQTNFS